MSFSIGRTYTLVAGRDYSGKNNNIDRFKSSVTSGTATLQVPSDVATRINTIVSNGSTAGIRGGSFPNYTLITGITGNTVTAGTASSITGDYEFSVFDANVPTSEDSPVLGLHVLAANAAITFTTFNGQSVTLPAGSIVAGGLYDYTVGTVSGVTGSIIGVAPVNKPFVI